MSAWTLKPAQKLRKRLRRRIRRALRTYPDSFAAAEATGLTREQVLRVQAYYRRPSLALVIVAAHRLGVLERQERAA